jgi:hypothetical protein
MLLYHVRRRVDVTAVRIGQRGRQPVPQGGQTLQIGLHLAQVVAEQGMGRWPVAQDRSDVVEPQPRATQCHGAGELDELGAPLAPVPRGVALGLDQAERLPVPEHPDRQARRRSDLADRQVRLVNHLGDART